MYQERRIQVIGSKSMSGNSILRVSLFRISIFGISTFGISSFEITAFGIWTFEISTTDQIVLTLLVGVLFDPWVPFGEPPWALD